MITKEQRLALRLNWAANHQAMQARDVVLRAALLAETDEAYLATLCAAFSPITSASKLKGCGGEPYMALGVAISDARWVTRDSVPVLKLLGIELDAEQRALLRNRLGLPNTGVYFKASNCRR